MTIGSWTSLSKDRYIVLTIHWIKVDFERHNIVLDFFQITESQTANQIRDAMLEILQDYKITHRMHAFAVDGALDFDKAVELVKVLLSAERRKRILNSDERTGIFGCLCLLNLIIFI